MDYLRGKTEVVTSIRDLARAPLYLSAISLGEIWEGVIYSQRPGQDGATLNQLLQVVEVLPVDASIARRFAELRGQLRKTGRPVDNFDLLIAATALCHDLVLLTRNVAHYERIEGLMINQLSPESPTEE
ncbi:MAG: type II toxin-antitoxin system VapC family toxin [Chloroflexi bacterium]|nr:type II toxin-antitoxin system VapC family toxin [Chloroflexota bacterium]